MAHIRPKGRGYQVRWRDPDGSERSRKAPTLDAARRLKREVEEDVALGRRWEPRDLRALPKIATVGRAFLTDMERTLSKPTADRYTLALVMFERFLQEKFGARRPVTADALTRNLLGEFFAWLTRTWIDVVDGVEVVRGTGLHRRPRTKDTARKQVEVVQLMWRWAANDDDLGADMPAPRVLDMERGSGRTTIAPTWAEVDACIEAIGIEWYRRLAIILRCTGLRVQQGMMIEWEHVDLDRAILHVTTGKSEQEKRGRFVPMAPALVEIMATWGRRDGFVIEPTRNKGVRERQARQREMRRAWERTAARPVVYEARPFHALRKCFVSGLKRAGADDEAVEYLIGHSLGLRGVYTDPDSLPMRDAVALVPAVGSSNVITIKRRGEA